MVPEDVAAATIAPKIPQLIFRDSQERSNRESVDVHASTALPGAISDGRSLVPLTLTHAALHDLGVPKGTPLSRQIVQELHREGLQDVAIAIRKMSAEHPAGLAKNLDATYESNSGGAPSHPPVQVRVPLYDGQRRISVKPVLLEQPVTVSRFKGRSSPLSLRKEREASVRFKPLGPGITKSGNFVPSTVFGDVNTYVKQKQAGSKERSPNLVDNLSCDMRNARANLENRQELVPTSTVPKDRTLKHLGHFEKQMEGRRTMTSRLAKQVKRRVEELAISDADNFRGFLEKQVLAEINQGPRSTYETAGPGLRPLGDLTKVLPKLLQNPPYENVTFTGKPQAMRHLMGTWLPEVESRSNFSAQIHLMLKDPKKKLHKKCVPDMGKAEIPPPGTRLPEFQELMVFGSNGSEPQRRLSSNPSRYDNLICTTGADLVSPLSTFSGKSVFEGIERPPSEASEEEQFSNALPFLDILPNCSEKISITRNENSVDIYVKLCAYPSQAPATTSLILTNKGPQALKFGLHPVPYKNPLWSEEKTGLIYFIQPSGVLETGDVHILTIVFECYKTGSFAESYKLWMRPETAEPINVSVVVHGRDLPQSILNFPKNTVEQWDSHTNATMFDLQMETYVKNKMAGLMEVNKTLLFPTFEETFRIHNNLHYQPGAILKLRYIWIFAHLYPESIPWYDKLIDREREHRGEVPAEITKHMLQKLAEAQEKSLGGINPVPEYVEREMASETQGVFWSLPRKSLRCTVHDKTLPIPDNAENIKSPEQRYAKEITQKFNVVEQLATGSVMTTSKQNSASMKQTGDNTQPNLRIPPFTFANLVSVARTDDQAKKTVSIEESDWIPLIPEGPISPDQRAIEILHRPKLTFRKPPFSQEQNSDFDFSPETVKMVGIVPEPENSATELLLDDRWIRHRVDEDWITTAVTYVIEGDLKINSERDELTSGPTENDDNGSKELAITIPEWNFRMETLKQVIQETSLHHIFIKVALLREVAKVERTMVHLQSNITLNFSSKETTEELIVCAMENVLQIALVYATDLFAYFERSVAGLRPEEPVIPPDLVIAREQMKATEAGLSVSGKSGQKPKKQRVAETAFDDQNLGAGGKIKGVSRDSGEKTALSLTRPSKSGSNSAKSNVSIKDGKRGGPTPAHTEGNKVEKEAKTALSVMETECEVAVEQYESKLAEYNIWKKEREAELEPKINAFVFSLWENELKMLNQSVQHPIYQLQQDEISKEEKLREVFLSERRENTLVKVYEKLVEQGGNLASAANGWKVRLTDNLMKQKNSSKYSKIYEEWELRRKELQVFRKERPDEICRLPVRNIWDNAYSYQWAAQQQDPVPLRLPRKGTSTIDLKAEPAKEALANTFPGPNEPPKMVPTTGKFAGMTSLAPIPEFPITVQNSSELRRTASATKVTPHKVAIEENSFIEKVVSTVRECLAGIQKRDDEQKRCSSDEWETDEEILVDSWMYEPAGPETATKLPPGFKFVSFKRPAEKLLRTTGMGPKHKIPVSKLLAKEEMSSSSSGDDL